MTYTHGHEESVLRSHRWRTAENSCAYLLPHLRPEMTLLDVGCGPGNITADLATRVASVTGIDPSAEVIAQVKRDNPQLDLRAERLEDHTGRGYDVVHAHQVLHHLQDPVDALRRMRELGSLVAVRESDYGAFRWGPDSAAIERWMEVFLAVMAHNRANPDAGRHLLHWAREVGFDDADYTTSTWTFAGDDARWWAGMWADRCTSSSFAEQAVAIDVADADELAAIAQGWREWSAVDGAAFICLHGEIIAR